MDLLGPFIDGITSIIPGKIRSGLLMLLKLAMVNGDTLNLLPILKRVSPGLTVYNN